MLSISPCQLIFNLCDDRFIHRKTTACNTWQKHSLLRRLQPISRRETNQQSSRTSKSKIILQSSHSPLSSFIIHHLYLHCYGHTHSDIHYRCAFSWPIPPTVPTVCPNVGLSLLANIQHTSIIRHHWLCSTSGLWQHVRHRPMDILYRAIQQGVTHNRFSIPCASIIPSTSIVVSAGEWINHDKSRSVQL